jgi:hypothetical protein
MEKQIHSSVKILKSVGEDTEKNLGVVALTEAIQESNKVTEHMFQELKAIRETIDGNGVRKEIDESIAKNNEFLLLKLKEQTQTIANSIINSTSKNIKDKLESINKYLLLKIAIGTFIIAFIISYLFGHYNTDQIKAIEETLKTITTQLGI